MVKDEIMSDPIERDMCTIRLKPMLASQAPIVSSNRARWGIDTILICIIDTIINIDVRSIASRQNSASRRWVYWNLNVIIKIEKANRNMIKMLDRVIELRRFHFWFTRSML